MHRKQLNHPEYNAFVQQTPMIGIWDDHDFGINDGSKAYTYRKESQQIFLDYFNEPVDSPRRKQEVCFVCIDDSNLTLCIRVFTPHTPSGLVARW